MNERTEKLAKQACKELADEGHSTDTALKMFPEKFAELIVRECLEVSSSAANVCDNNSYVCRKVKEHFGVEE